MYHNPLYDPAPSELDFTDISTSSLEEEYSRCLGISEDPYIPRYQRYSAAHIAEAIFAELSLRHGANE